MKGKEMILSSSFKVMVGLLLLFVSCLVMVTGTVIVEAGSAGNQGDIEFYLENSSEPIPTKPSSSPKPDHPGQSKPDLPQASERVEHFYFIVGVSVLIATFFLRVRRMRRETGGEVL